MTELKHPVCGTVFIVGQNWKDWHGDIMTITEIIPSDMFPIKTTSGDYKKDGQYHPDDKSDHDLKELVPEAAMNKIHYFMEDSFFAMIRFGVCFDEESYKQHVIESGNDENKFPWLSKDACMHTIPFEDGTFTLLTTYNPETLKASSVNAIIGLVAHESTHVLQRVKIIIGEKDMGEETEAYFMQYTVQNCIGIINNEVFNSRLFSASAKPDIKLKL